jgi:hypothetical protein
MPPTFAPGAAAVRSGPTGGPPIAPTAPFPVVQPNPFPPPAGYIPPASAYRPGPPQRGRGLVIALSITTAIFVLVSAALAYLFLAKTSDYNKQTSLVADRNSTIAANQAKINDLNSRLQQATDQAQQLQQQITGTQNQLAAIQAEEAALKQCIHSVNNFFNLVAQNASTSDLNKAADQLNTDCGQFRND